MLEIDTITAREIIAPSLPINHFVSNTITPFNLSNVQAEFLEIINSNDKVICLKSRQVYITTVCLFYCLMVAITYPGSQIAIVMPDHTKAVEKLDVIRRWSEYLGMELEESTQHELVYVNSNDTALKGSSIKAIWAGNPDSQGRGGSLNLALLSEPPFYTDFAATWRTLAPSLQFAKVIMESTPRGPKGLYPGLFTGVNEWKSVFFSLEAFNHLVRDPKEIAGPLWAELQKHGFTSQPHAAWWWYTLQNTYHGDIAALRQNYPLTEAQAWMGLQGKYIDTAPEIIPHTIHDLLPSDFHIFFPAIKEQKYVWGYDPSGTIGGDHSAIAVFDLQGKLMASYYNNKTESDHIVKMLGTLAKIYPPQVLVIERNGVGAPLASFIRAHSIAVIEKHTGEASKALNFLACLRACENGTLKGDNHLHSEAVTLERRYKESGSTKPFWWGADDLLTACGLALNYLNLIPTPALPPPPPDPTRYHSTSRRKEMNRSRFI